MRKMKEDSRRKLPHTLYNINFDPSPNAQKILGISPAPASLKPEDSPCPSPDLDPLPFPTLCSALKKDVFKNTPPPPPPPRRRLFSAPNCSSNTSPQLLVPAAPEESKLTKEGCPIKEGQRYRALSVSSSPQPEKTGNGTSDESQCGKNGKKDESLSVEPKRSDEV